MSTDNKPLKITVWLDNDGQLELKNFYFPRDWSYEQRKEFVSNYSQVLQVEVTVHESDLVPFEHNMSVGEYEEAMSNFYEYSQKTQREYWEAQNFEDQRGDV
jgi:hypothetical protein